jgi:carboxyl-terminal processing protease
MRRWAALALLLLASVSCRSATLRSLDELEARTQLSASVFVTLERQRHYFASDEERASFRKRLQAVAADASDALSYYRGVADALAILDEGHTGLLAPPELPIAGTIPPVAIVEALGQPVVAGVAAGVEGGGLRPGDVVLEVDGRPAAEVLGAALPVTAASTDHARRARALSNLMAGPTDTPASVRVRGVDGRERWCYPLRFLLEEGEEVRLHFGYAPRHVSVLRLSDEAGYIALPDFQAERTMEFEHAMELVRGLPLLVLDLRGNPGGRIRTLREIASMFLDHPTELLEYRDGARRTPVRVRAGARPYTGSVAVLVDERTGSAAELMAAAFQDLGRGTIYGRPTAGSTRVRRSALLPGGVVFHYAGRGEFRRRDGRAVEGTGVLPDVRIEYSREALARGSYGIPARDPAVLVALGRN